ncbi:MAG: transcription antitermination protein NusB [Bacteroidetes bacterium]|nr:transcription antitermination protein NusB [Bacteroidota bacterium]
MLNRRFLRIKVMQELYAFFQHEKAEIALFEKEMFKNLDKIYDLYLTILQFICELHNVATLIVDENKNKRLPTKEDLTPNLKFVNNAVLCAISKNKELTSLTSKKKINWNNDADLIRKLFNDIRTTKLYKDYMKNEKTSLSEDRDFIVQLVTDYLSQNDVLLSFFEDKNMHWADDSFVAYNSVIRNIESYEGKEFKLLPLLKDEKDDFEFMSTLFRKTIQYRNDFITLISKHTTNWEIERIAAMDMLLMQMTLAEIMYLPRIPVKASLNEYIDISKEYSTPQSKLFLNGVLDKIVIDLKQQNKIVKEGKGLKEN